MSVVLEDTDTPVWRLQMVPDGEGRITLDGERVRAIEQALGSCAEAGCRVLVIAGGEGQFCRGMDLAELLTRQDRAAALQADLAAYATCIRAIAAGPVAVVCLVDGEVLGGGVGLMAACDIVLATERASLALPELTVGLVPAVVLPVLQRRVGVHRARYLSLRGARVSAEQAQAWGLVDTVVDATDELEKQLRRELKGLLRTRPEAVARLKQINEVAATSSLNEGLAAGVARTAADMVEPEVVAAVTAMAEGELPPWFTRYRKRAH